MRATFHRKPSKWKPHPWDAVIHYISACHLSESAQLVRAERALLRNGRDRCTPKSRSRGCRPPLLLPMRTFSLFLRRFLRSGAVLPFSFFYVFFLHFISHYFSSQFFLFFLPWGKNERCNLYTKYISLPAFIRSYIDPCFFFNSFYNFNG